MITRISSLANRLLQNAYFPGGVCLHFFCSLNTSSPKTNVYFRREIKAPTSCCIVNLSPALFLLLTVSAFIAKENIYIVGHSQKVCTLLSFITLERLSDH